MKNAARTPKLLKLARLRRPLVERSVIFEEQKTLNTNFKLRKVCCKKKRNRKKKKQKNNLDNDKNSAVGHFVRLHSVKSVCIDINCRKFSDQADNKGYFNANKKF